MAGLFRKGTARRQLIRIVLVLLCIAAARGNALAEEATCAKGWHGVQTRHTLLCFEHREDLGTFNKSVDFGPGKWNRAPFFGSLSESDVEAMLRPKIDAMFERVQEILDMRKKMERVRVEVYADKASLSKAYSRFYRGECRIRAWYNVHNNTVYLNVKDVHAGMVAHELAHAIIDHYLLVRPPRQTAEILARYVDSHLQ